MHTQLLVFDVAGTTVRDDDAVARVFSEVLIERGVAPSYLRITAVMGLAKPVALRILLQKGGVAPTDAVVAAAHADFEDRMIDHYQRHPDVGPIEGAEAAFARVRERGCRIALDTGFSRRVLDAVLARVGWVEGEAIDFAIASDEVPRGRPFPDMIHAAMARAGVRDPDRVAKIGDTVADLREGAAACCGLVIGVTSGTTTRDVLLSERPTRVLASVAAVPDLLFENPVASRRGPGLLAGASRF